MKLSLIVPSIRTQNLPKLHESINKSYSGKWEFIVIGPYVPEFIPKNMIFIQSKANPTVCQQLGLLQANGDYVCFGWDDGWFMPDAIDKMFEQLEPNTAISGKYIEGDIAPEYMKSKKYYIINTHTSASSPYLDDTFMLLNTGIIPRNKLLDIGGFDCRFQTTAISAVDMAIRIQLFGTKIILSEDIILKCSWLPGEEGDHKPINDSMEDDFSLLHKKYRQPIFHKRIIIPIDNWKNEPQIWEKRFK